MSERQARQAAGAWSCAAAALLVAAAGLPSYSGAQQLDLLDPEKAFRISMQRLDQRNVEVQFEIADGYYLYRDRFKFETAAGKVLADVALPKGKVKEDPFFGSTETYRRLVRIRVPLAPEDIANRRVRLKVTSQGCADIGVCYVPLVQLVEMGLPGGSSNAPATQIPPPPSWTDIPPKALRKGAAAAPQGGSR